MGCPMPQICLAPGESCPPVCPHHPHPKCEEMGNGMTTGCGGGLDSNGCPMPQICLAPGESCPPVCPHHPHPKCEEMGNGMTTGCGGGLDSNGSHASDLPCSWRILSTGLPPSPPPKMRGNGKWNDYWLWWGPGLQWMPHASDLPSSGRILSTGLPSSPPPKMRGNGKWNDYWLWWGPGLQ